MLFLFEVKSPNQSLCVKKERFVSEFMWGLCLFVYLFILYVFICLFYLLIDWLIDWFFIFFSTQSMSKQSQLVLHLGPTIITTNEFNVHDLHKLIYTSNSLQTTKRQETEAWTTKACVCPTLKWNCTAQLAHSSNIE